MRGTFGQLALLAAAAVMCGRANAVNAAGACRVVAGEKLPPQSGGPDALCTQVERAIASGAPNVAYKAEITVLSSTRLAAVVVVNGRTLPEQKFAIVDHELNSGALERFAQALAAEVAKAAKP